MNQAKRSEEAAATTASDSVIYLEANLCSILSMFWIRNTMAIIVRAEVLLYSKRLPVCRVQVAYMSWYEYVRLHLLSSMN